MKIRFSIITLLFIALSTLTVRAQIGDLRNNIAIGINGGVNMNKVSFSPTVKQKNLMGITGGITARYISEKYFSMICGAQLELNFSQRGWDEFYEDFPDLTYTRTMNYVEIPFLAHIGFGKEPRGLQFFIHAGPQIGFFIGDSFTISESWETTTGGVTEQHTKDVENKFDYGIAGGGGLELRTKAGNFLLEGRYYYALSDFYKSTKKDYFARSAHNGITIKLTYLFDLKK
ncbi:MAG: PorT family protein [Mediterranea massiliensis]|nr:PorT family protein [Mediterranea massiliensis]